MAEDFSYWSSHFFSSEIKFSESEIQWLELVWRWKLVLHQPLEAETTQQHTDPAPDKQDMRQKKRLNFITVVMSGEKDLCGCTDPGSRAYLQTCSRNTSGQLISYTLICREDPISPIRPLQYSDSLGLNFIQLTGPMKSTWVKLLLTAYHTHVNKKTTRLTSTLIKHLYHSYRISVSTQLSQTEPNQTKYRLAWSQESVLSVKSNYTTSQVSTGLWKWPTISSIS